MSEKLPKENNELAQVLNRINTLMKHGEVQAESATQTKNIPQLTEIYEGEPLVFISRPTGESSTLNEFVSDSSTDVVAVAAKTSDQAEKMEALLAEIAPLLQTAIKKAAQQKLIATELHEKIGLEIMQTLRERLQSLVVNGKP
jgi:type IV secretory pathway VirJ component